MDIDKKTVQDLNGYKFFIPSYQRGYRWTTVEVEALLNDIEEFSHESDQSKKYCLQPLIVQKREDGSYEVVDGQQRLTTILIFMRIVESKTEDKAYNIQFETRGDSQKFLDSLSSYNGEIDKSNIDYFHITTAYNTISNWLKKGKNYFNTLTAMYNTITERVFFIWYELPRDSKTIDTYTKVNMGKIPLTDAELIKALLMDRSHFKNDENYVYKKKLEISVEWDRIEQGLQNESLWCFLNEPKTSGTRIDLIFNLLKEKYRGDFVVDEGQSYSTFLIFDNALKNYDSDKEKFVYKLWGDVKAIYSAFCNWYADLNKYHIIGYLISTGISIKEIFKLVGGKRKSEAIKLLIAKTHDGLKLKNFDLKQLNYDDNKTKIRNILLLFNIATLVCKGEKQYRFPFEIFKAKDNPWDIEHIHATADDTDEPDDLLGNLTLLSAKINRSYKAEGFPVKRGIILENDAKGIFIPICTKNVFLKAYTKNPTDLTIWDDSDKSDYVNAIDDTLKKFWNGEIDGGESYNEKN